MTDPDPPDEIRDRETPCDRNVHAPDADAFQQQPRDRKEKHHQERECDREAEDPTARSGRVRTTSVIFFVTDALSYPGATMGLQCALIVRKSEYAISGLGSAGASPAGFGASPKPDPG